MTRLLTTLALVFTATASAKVETYVAEPLNNPFGLTRGPDGALYVCDTGNHCIRRIAEDKPVTTVAGTPGKKGYAGDGGAATEALCFEPYEIRFDREGNMVFVEMQNHLVRKVDAKTGKISTIAGNGKKGFSGDGGPATGATFNRPHSIGFAPDGRLFICDIGNHRLRVVDPETGIITTIAGTGKKAPTPDGAQISPKLPLNGPRAIDFDKDGDLWLALREGNAVYKLDLDKNTIHHIAGTGKKGFTGNGDPAKKATLSGPKGVSIGPDGNVYLADTESHSVRMIDLKRNTLELVAGDGKKGPGQRFARLHGVFVDHDGSVWVGDSENHRVAVIRPE